MPTGIFQNGNRTWSHRRRYLSGFGNFAKTFLHARTSHYTGKNRLRFTQYPRCHSANPCHRGNNFHIPTFCPK